MWKDIKGFEGIYQVSNLGEVRSLDRTVSFNGKSMAIKGEIKKQSLVNKGYMKVTLYKNNVGTGKYVHRLVAETFINNKDNKPTVNHKDFNKLNNNVDNLEWNTYFENNQHSFVNGRHENKKYKDVTVIYKDGKVLEFNSICQTAKAIKCHRDTIYSFLNGMRSVKIEELLIKDIIVK